MGRAVRCAAIPPHDRAAGHDIRARAGRADAGRRHRRRARDGARRAQRRAARAGDQGRRIGGRADRRLARRAAARRVTAQRGRDPLGPPLAQPHRRRVPRLAGRDPPGGVRTERPAAADRIRQQHRVAHRPADPAALRLPDRRS